ncbi:MAG: glycosyl transferase family protein [Erythrobacter sp.]|uniref:glycosyl transferase family protein n=1 Tax=Erythrobacter sp. TaxID=1042 RepID=UPI001AFDA7B9|nr:glycosyl transferase family protein [Erythrobacter sp.]MBO6769337.1 glycosyl transferase family protein [Erythrobacter sp.]
MVLGSFTIAEWFVLVQHELLLFAAAFFALGMIDEFALDCTYLWCRVTGRIQTERIDEAIFDDIDGLAGRAAVFIPAWQEANVLGPTLVHMLDAWPQDELTVYVGCYRNDAATMASVIAAVRGDPRVRLIVHERDGPTSKADCLNRLHAALTEDERRSGIETRMVVLHDAEDMVDPMALDLLDRALWHAHFVQLPVLALPQRHSPWIGSHYSDEFAESHGKALVVRDALGAAIPGAGVGCAVARGSLKQLAEKQGGLPFAAESLTEDYELGLKIAAAGGRGRFLRVRAADGRLIATRAFFPSRLNQSVRQKTRWMHGIALQGWDRLGWGSEPVELWMQLRDRRGPLAAILLVIAYLLFGFGAAGLVLQQLGLVELPMATPLLTALLWINFAGLSLRFLVRAAFTAREYGWRQGLLAIPRTIVSNVIAIMAGRRALLNYVGTLRGAPVIWDKTEHRDHPALLLPTKGRA